MLDVYSPGVVWLQGCRNVDGRHVKQAEGREWQVNDLVPMMQKRTTYPVVRQERMHGRQKESTTTSSAAVRVHTVFTVIFPFFDSELHTFVLVARICYDVY